MEFQLEQSLSFTFGKEDKILNVFCHDFDLSIQNVCMLKIGYLNLETILQQLL